MGRNRSSMVKNGGRKRSIGADDLEGGNKQHIVGPTPSPTRPRWYQMWEKLMLALAVFSIVFTPIQFAFFEVSPKIVMILVDAAHLLFVVDELLQYSIVYNRNFSNYGCSRWLYIPACIPWMFIYWVAGGGDGDAGFTFKELIRLFLFSRMCHLVNVTRLFSNKGKSSKLGFLSSYPVKKLALDLFVLNVWGCIYFYSSIITSQSKQGNTWIGSLILGEENYFNFRKMAFWNLYITSTYFGGMSVTTGGYGDVHPVNAVEKIIAVVLSLSLNFLTGRIASDGLPIKAHNSDDEKGDSDGSGQGSSPVSNVNGKPKQKKKKKHLAHLIEASKLINGDTNINSENTSGKTALHLAAIERDVGKADTLIKIGAEVNAIDKQGNTPVLEALKARDEEMTRFLRAKGANVMLGEAAATLLYLAVASNDVDYVKWLLESGMNPNVQDGDGNTLFHLAASESCSLAMMEVLAKQKMVLK